jgi:phosphoribosyl-ATP pyrophosphohydrolase/phosphoribosyl-AMP cyclohydrolase
MYIDFDKGDGLVPVVIQDSTSLQVLMLGYMNKEAFEKTQSDKIVTFYSRSKQRLWTKGETSGHTLIVDDITVDCDNDSILIMATPNGPTCHNGTISCFNREHNKGFMYQLEKIIGQRIKSGNTSSYTHQLFHSGINKMAQKVGEEAVELVIESKDNNMDLFCNEAADLLYHLFILLHAKQVTLDDIESILRSRHNK